MDRRRFLAAMLAPLVAAAIPWKPSIGVDLARGNSRSVRFFYYQKGNLKSLEASRCAAESYKDGINILVGRVGRNEVTSELHTTFNFDVEGKII